MDIQRLIRKLGTVPEEKMMEITTALAIVVEYGEPD
jgi:mRNA-degrading endonuclease toxin of MazEF toxin-antitoxin module